MARKSYKQHCGVARALDVVGERWTLLLVRNLLLGPRRYSDLLSELPGITSNLLAKRLRELEGLALIERSALAPPLGPTVYRLTASGRALEPVIMELGRFGGRFMTAPRRGDTFDLGWAFLSLKRRYHGGLACTLLIAAGERRFSLVFSTDYLSVEERAMDRPELFLSGDEAAVRALFFEGVSCAQLERSGKLQVSGKRALVRGLARYLDLPAAAQSGAQRRATTRRKLSNKNSSVASKRSV